MERTQTDTVTLEHIELLEEASWVPIHYWAAKNAGKNKFKPDLLLEFETNNDGRPQRLFYVNI